jgi:hypothetical protein
MPQVLYQVDRNQCYAMGGFPSVCANNGYGPANICKCTIPDPPAPAPAAAAAPTITTNISPNISVSPQISPNFVQQFQPSASPVTAGTLQSGSGTASSVPTATAAPASQTVPVSAPTGVVPVTYSGTPAASVPAYTPAASPSYSGGDSTGGAITYAGNPSTPAQAVATVDTTTQPDRTMLYAGIGAAALLLLFLMKPRRA